MLVFVCGFLAGFGLYSRVVPGQHLFEKMVIETGLAFSDGVQARIYLTKMSDWNPITGIYDQYLHETYPAQATVMVTGLPKDAKVEIGMIKTA